MPELDAREPVARLARSRSATFAVDGAMSIATPHGPVPAAELASGCAVLTFDDGPQRLRMAASRHAPEAAPLIAVPAGLVGNDAEMPLTPDQPVLVESCAAEALTGCPFAVLPASALLAAQGVRRTRAARCGNLVMLAFARRQAVLAAGGAVVVMPGAPGPRAPAGRARYAPLDARFVPAVVEEIDDGACGVPYAAMA